VSKREALIEFEDRLSELTDGLIDDGISPDEWSGCKTLGEIYRDHREDRRLTGSMILRHIASKREHTEQGGI
jgi:hypothetical protein